MIERKRDKTQLMSSEVFREMAQILIRGLLFKSSILKRGLALGSCLRPARGPGQARPRGLPLRSRSWAQGSTQAGTFLVACSGFRGDSQEYGGIYKDHMRVM